MKGQDIEGPVSVEAEGVNARGFGTVPQSVMRDPSLSVEAKAIYAYLCSFAGAGGAAFPSRRTMLDELGISKSRFYKHREPLVARGLVKVVQRTDPPGAGGSAVPVKRTVYILASVLPANCIAPGHDGCPQNEDTGREGEGEFSTIPRSIRLSSNLGQPLPEDGDCPQNEDTVCPQNRATIYKVKSNNENKPTDLLSNLPSRSASPADGRSVVERDYEALSSRESTPNRNRLRDGLEPYMRLRAVYDAAIVAEAWRMRQSQAREAGWPACYYPQLASWLADSGQDGGAAMCAVAAEARERRRQSDTRLVLSLDEGYMALRAELSDIEMSYRDQGVPASGLDGDPRARKLMAELDDRRAAAYAEVCRKERG